ncbi:hypothetical protein B0H14DRAFT_3680818 [Mycena olivaceomarginata]|nr:hypothetical protein B0H14DRAFT_3680818 [Mycena olivaceomarginata]
MTRYFGRYSRGGASKSKSTTELRLGDNLSDANKQVIPDSASYTIETVKQLAETVKSAASIIPFPGLSTVLTVAIKVLEACEEATVIEENVKGLHQRVCKLMLAVVHTVSKETSQELQGRITSLQSVLESILADVDKIKQQKQWLLVFFHGLNKERVDKCVGRLNVALEDFQVVGQLRVEDLLDKINTLLEKIKADSSTTAAQLDRIEDTVNRISQPHNAPSAVLRQDMPPPHHIFCGRDGLVKDIASLLAITDTSRVCITGVGGMGKTSVALAVIESVMKKGIFQKDSASRPSHTTALTVLEEELKVNSKQRRLLLLDNFETPWLSNPGQDQANVRDILVRLAKLPHIALLVTMTSGFAPGIGIRWEHRPLLPLDPAAARVAFQSKYREAASNSGRELAELDGLLNRPELDELLTSIGHIPLAITLAAANGGDLTNSLSDLLRDWKKAGTAMMPGEERLSMDETIRLSMERPVVKSNDDARTLLAILSMLPAGTTGANLRWWAPNLKSLSTAVRSLRTAALIEQGSGPFETSRIFLRPTIQSYMSHEGRISAEIREQVHDACYKFVLGHKSIPDDRKFKDDLKALGGEEINLQGLLMEIPIDAPRTDAIDALIAFGFYQAWTKPSTVVASRALDIARATHDGRLDAAARRIAEAHHCLGRTLHRLDRYDEACPHFEEARRWFENLPGGADLHCAGECSMELSDTWMYMQKPKVEIASLVQKAMTDLSHDETERYYVAGPRNIRFDVRS